MNFCTLLCCAAPSAAPLSVRVTVLSADSVRIQWRNVNCLDANGVIQLYVVNSTAPDVAFMNLTADTMLTVTGLRAGLQYSFQVAAINAIGAGPFSEPIVVDIPGEKPKFLWEGG